MCVCVFVCDVENAQSALKCGKAAGFEGLRKKSVAYCHPKIIVHCLMWHGLVPDDYGTALTIDCGTVAITS